MTIEIANRLVNLRKEKGFSQEELAEKLGLSRQAVSKWERAEASPDTDNLILLAKIYGVSLDQLLSVDADDEEILKQSNQEKEQGDHVHLSFKEGIHIVDGKDEVHVGWSGIHIKENGSDQVHIAKDRIFVNGKEYDGKRKFFRHTLVPLCVTFGFFWAGFAHGLWHPAWLLFFIIPLVETFLYAIEKRDAAIFAYPVLVVAAFLVSGFYWDMWHPMWVLFFTIPVYYGVCAQFKK